jgi:hypothetical protein
MKFAALARWRLDFSQRDTAGRDYSDAPETAILVLCCCVYEETP